MTPAGDPPGEVMRVGVVGRCRRLLRPVGVRGRLLATYTVAALVVAVVGGSVFTVELGRAVRANVDASLVLQAAPVVSELLTPGVPDLPDPPLDRAPGGPVTALTLVYRPDGVLADAQPRRLPAAPLPAAEVHAAQRGPVRSTRTVGQTRVRLLAQPVHRADGVWVVVVGSATGLVDQTTDQVRRALVWSGVALLVGVGVGVWMLSGAALRPVERMRARAAELGADDRAGRLGVPPTRDGLAALATTLNELLDRLHDSAGRQRALVADAGHELRTPLAVLRVELELADRPGRSRDELAEAVGAARVEVDRLTRLANDLLLLARADEGHLFSPDQLAPLDLRRPVGEAVQAWRAMAATRAVGLRMTGGPSPVPVRGDHAGLRRAVENLLSNALAATGPGGRVEVDVRSDPHEPAQASIAVRDTGPGFPSEYLPHAFERFRRPDISRGGATGGSGLGLAITAEIAHAHGGSASAANRAGGGAEVVVRVPAARGVPDGG